ncbi:uncharacterized protein LOC141860713 [Acropora palmata]|uniref:uncharacterized protein LOC141860713 n=1 Tax=Acropora palmata TaxID=6131 RepID=UPI003DA1407E
MATSCFVLFTLAFFPTTRAADLGKSVCQDMWNRAGNNLKIPSELGVASTGTVVPLFQVKSPGGTAKIGQPVFVKIDALLKSYFNDPSSTSLRASEFIDAVTIPGGPIEIAFKYLQDIGKVGKSKVSPAFMSGLRFTWRTATKKAASSLFVGTSPAFDLALFTVCFIAFKDKPCSCNIGRSTITIQTYSVNSSPDLIATAYPAKVEMPAGRCSIPPDDDCGWVGIDQKHCEDRGCCWLPKDKTNWCFYPKDHKCYGIPPSKRQECGYLGIQREQCEIGRDCCFDHSVPNVPFCFKGNP